MPDAVLWNHSQEVYREQRFKCNAGLPLNQQKMTSQSSFLCYEMNMIPNFPYQSRSPIKAFKFPSDSQVKVNVDIKTPRRIWEMVQQLGVVNALSERWISSAHTVVYNHLHLHFQKISGLCGYQAHTWCTYTHAGKTQIHKK